jgi:hypothetical protein
LALPRKKGPIQYCTGIRGAMTGKRTFGQRWIRPSWGGLKRTEVGRLNIPVHRAEAFSLLILRRLV